MQEPQLNPQIEHLQQRVTELRRLAAAGPEQLDELLPEVIEELLTTLEELQVAEEELRQQNEELVAANQAVEAERRRYLELFDMAPDGYLVIDARRIIHEANRSAAQMLNVSPQFLAGKPFLIFLAEGERKSFHIQLAQLTRQDRIENWETCLQPRDGELFYASITITRVRDTDGEATGYRFLIRDVTECKRVEEALRESEARYRLLSENLDKEVKRKVAELRQAESLAAIGRMVSTVAHEVRNPLQNIRLGIDSIRKRIPAGKENLEILEETEYGVSMLDGLIGELLEYAKPLIMHYSLSSLGNIVRHALKSSSNKLSNIDIKIELEQEDLEISVDVAKITAVLVNIISNATDAMPAGGTLTIGSRFYEDNGARFLILYITDTGYGIEEQNRERIYEPFFTTKTRGVGLGLPACRKIVAAHNGILEITSKLGAGTTVTITLPIQSG